MPRYSQARKETNSSYPETRGSAALAHQMRELEVERVVCLEADNRRREQEE